MVKLSETYKSYLENIIKNFKGVDYVEQDEFPYLETILKRGNLMNEKVEFKSGAEYINDYDLVRMWMEWYDNYSEQILFENK